MVTPANILLNRGFSTLHFEGAERRLVDIRWRTGFASVADALARPGAAVERAGGWGTVLRREFLAGGRVWEWAWAPNIGGHLIGGGVTWRYLAEWFDERGAPAPGVSAAAFLMATMVVNEALENQHSPVGNASTLADLLIFDPLGMLLFSVDGVARFFRDELRAADWSPQAAVSVSGRVQNVSQNLAYKVPLPLLGRTRLLVILGQMGITGLTREFDGGLSLGVGFGFDGNARFVDEATGAERIEPRLATGVFVDRDDSLLASVVGGPDAFTLLKANVYPGVLPGRLESFGLWATLNRDGEFSFGVSSRGWLGLATGFDVNHR